MSKVDYTIELRRAKRNYKNAEVVSESAEMLVLQDDITSGRYAAMTPRQQRIFDNKMRDELMKGSWIWQ